MATAMVVLGVASVTPGPAAAAQAKPKSGGTLTYLLPADINQIDSAKIASTPNVAAAQMVYSALITIDPQTLKPVMRLAQSLSSNSASTVWTMKLRPGLKFSDGTPLDAAAVVANWDREKVPEVASNCRSTISGLTSYVAQDSTTVVITLPEARTGFPNQLGGCMTYISSPQAATKFGLATGASPEASIGAGPYIWKDWARGSQATFVRNPNYWDKPRPYVDTVIAKPVQDVGQALTAWQAGQGDLAFTNGITKAAQDAATATGGTVFGYPTAGGGADV
ncbi:MAG: ABC transporter substrate-binding protein, partial [Acidimicrobiia bacterium]